MKKLALILIAAGLVFFCSCSSSKKTEEVTTKTGEEVEMKTEAKAETNPLMGEFDTPYQVPPFDKIKVEHYLPAVKEGIKRHQAEIDAIVNNSEPATFENTLEALEKSGSMLTRVNNVFDVLQDSMTNPDMQKAAKKIAPLNTKHGDSIRLNEKLFARIKAVHEKKDSLNLSKEQDKLLEKYYKDFVRGGANLDPEQKTRLKAINEELSLLSLKFGDNILEENNRFKMVLENKEDLAGLPQSSIDAAAEAAKENGLEGKWVFTLHKPSLIPFIQYSDKRELREKMFKGYITRGDHNDKLDTKAILLKMAGLRAEKAKLLGYETHAHYQLEENMAKNPDTVYKFLHRLWKPALEMAKREAKALQEMIDKEGGNFKLQPWDWWYYAEKLKKAKYELDDNILRPYFKLENVRNGVFAVATKLFGIKFIKRSDITSYHKDAEVFEVQEADGTHVGILYVDYFPRASKRGGAWMNAFRKQSNREGKMVRPVITNNGNFSKPTADKPALLTFEEVLTMFHEFGHALHGLLSDCTYEKLSGTDVAIDFVELQSQIMENWASHPEVLKMYAKHYQTGEVIPQELVDKVKKAGQFNQGFATVEYLAASFLDLDWHSLTGTEGLDVNDFETKKLNEIGLIPEIVVRYRSSYFSHIFSGMYSAGYYSYIWAEVLDADAFEAFKEKGIFDPATAKSYRENILERGGTEDAMELYKRFRGREPKVEALLKKKGLN
jgi:peptidyl-dipeptidase Dcp